MTGMDLDRFRALAETYGGDIRRWPEAERDGAAALAAVDQGAASALAEAALLDEALDDWRVEPAGLALRDRVATGAPTARRSWSVPVWAGRGEGLRLWFAGAGLAAGLLGVSCGVILSTAAVREARDEAMVAAAYHDSSSTLSSFSEPVRTL